MARSTVVHERNVMIARAFIACAVLVVPTMLMIALIAYAMFRREETHPWSHRSVAHASPGELVVGSA